MENITTQIEIFFKMAYEMFQRLEAQVEPFNAAVNS